jgi:hypothetical protein
VPIVCREGALASGMFSLKGSITVKLGDLGLDSAEINSGGFLPAPHLPIEDLRASQNAREEYLELFTAQFGLARHQITERHRRWWLADQAPY